jgi:hypothetical protein
VIETVVQWWGPGASLGHLLNPQQMQIEVLFWCWWLCLTRLSLHVGEIMVVMKLAHNAMLACAAGTLHSSLEPLLP